MSEQQEYGPWIDHAGDCIPVPSGTMVECELRSGVVVQAMTGFTLVGEYGVYKGERKSTGSAWIWADNPTRADVIRYRVRKPRALIELRNMVENLPKPEVVG